MPLSYIRQRVINGYQHIMACPLVRAWVVVVVVHFIVQVVLQSITLKDNMEAKNATSIFLSIPQVPVGVPLLKGDDLGLCDGIPGHRDVTCILISSMKDLPLMVRNDVGTSSLANFDLDDIYNVTMSGSEHSITGRCALSLQWIHDVFLDNASEDIATISFQFWLLVVSLLAVLQDSIPHLVVCIASHFLDVGWAGFRMKSTLSLLPNYYGFVVYGACGGEDLLGDWWDRRLDHAGPLFGTNVVTLFLLAALSAVLFQRYVNNTFGRVGVSAPITRMYKLALSFSAFLQLAAFFTIIAVGMWIERITCSPMTTLGYNIWLYQAAFFILAAIIAPWIISGWWAIFREIKWAFILFAGLHMIPLILWPAMFASAIYRYVFVTWSFFACVSITSYLFVIATAIMAVICRLHFGRGLGHFLRVEADLSSSGFPASFFVNETTHARSGSPASFNFNLSDSEKAGKGFIEDDEGPIHIRPFALESSKYSAHSLSFETSTNRLDTPVTATFHSPGATSLAIIQTLNKGNQKPLLAAGVDSEARSMGSVSRTDGNGPKNTTLTCDIEKSWIQPPPDVHLQAPSEESRLRKETPSLITQATGISTNSYTQAVISFARKDPVVSATATTMPTNTVPLRRTQSPVDMVIPHEDRPSIDSGTRISVNMVSQQRSTSVRIVNGVQQRVQPAASTNRETNGGAGRDVLPYRISLSKHPYSHGGSKDYV